MLLFPLHLGRKQQLQRLQHARASEICVDFGLYISASQGDASTSGPELVGPCVFSIIRRILSLGRGQVPSES